MPYLPNGPHSTMLFEQIELGGQRVPGLTNFSVLRSYANQHGMKLYGYIGFPRCDVFPEDPDYPYYVFEHCEGSSLNRWYGPIVSSGFIGLGHDWTGNLPNGSSALSVNFSYLRSRGVEPFVESIFRREQSHLLGYSVVALERAWIAREGNKNFFSEDEVIAAGGRAIHLVNFPPDGTCSNEDEQNACVQAWRWQTTKSLLQAGKTVTVSLVGLNNAGYDLSELLNYLP